MPKQAIGKDLYLFTNTPGSYLDACVISAHGGWSKSNGKLNVPSNATLNFYVLHGSLQNDFGVYRFRHAPPVAETLGPGVESYNYELSKYQGRHGGTAGKPAETYDSIDDTLAAVEEEVLKMKKNMLNAKYKKMVDIGAKKMPSTFDVVTVRNRTFGGDMTLNSLIKQVSGIHAYKQYHCFFCRGLI